MLKICVFVEFTVTKKDEEFKENKERQNLTLHFNTE
jgi:hypothetical protein